MTLEKKLKTAVQNMAVRTSLDDLKKKGVQQVNVLGLERIVTLVATAVHRSLRSQVGGVDRQAVTDATKAEFLRLLRSNEDLQRQKSEVDRQKQEAEEEIAQLRAELAQQNEALQAKLAADAAAVDDRHRHEDAEVARQVAAAMQSLGGTEGAPVTEAQAAMTRLVLDLLAGERRAANEARRALQDREVETLQRRIQKLTSALGQTEQRLQAAVKNDAGLASGYRPEQGLTPDAADAARKKELLTEIYQTNLELQKRTGEGTDPSPARS
ncbi:MAG: hypothetical protein WAT39_23760 [Planctomycetota bacterium]